LRKKRSLLLFTCVKLVHDLIWRFSCPMLYNCARCHKQILQMYLKSTLKGAVKTLKGKLLLRKKNSYFLRKKNNFLALSPHSTCCLHKSVFYLVKNQSSHRQDLDEQKLILIGHNSVIEGYFWLLFCGL